MKKGELIASQGEERTDEFIAIQACSPECVFLEGDLEGGVVPFHVYNGGGPPWYQDSVTFAAQHGFRPQGNCNQRHHNGAGGNPGWCMTRVTKVSQ